MNVVCCVYQYRGEWVARNREGNVVVMHRSLDEAIRQFPFAAAELGLYLAEKAH